MEESFSKNFLYPYYRIASSFPQRLGQFYVEDRSIISRGNVGYCVVGKNTAATAILNPLPLGFSVADEPSFILQPLYSELKLQWQVLINGFIRPKERDEEMQAISFSQSMVLSPEETESGRRYFILSDLFHAESKPMVSVVPRSIPISSRRCHTLWDLENNHIPSSFLPASLWFGIDAQLKRLGFDLVSAVGIGNTNGHFSGEEHKDTRVELMRKGFKFEYGESRTGKPLSADFLINSAIWKWSWTHGRLGDALLISTGDVDFAPIIRHLVRRHFVVILAYNERATQELIDSTPLSFPWADAFIGM